MTPLEFPERITFEQANQRSWNNLDTFWQLVTLEEMQMLVARSGHPDLFTEEEQMRLNSQLNRVGFPLVLSSVDWTEDWEKVREYIESLHRDPKVREYLAHNTQKTPNYPASSKL